MSSPLSAGGAAGVVRTSPMSWMVLCTGASVGAVAGKGAIAAAEIDLEGALSLASFLTTYSAVFCVSVSLAYSSGICLSRS
jgi:hypothetical protein